MSDAARVVQMSKTARMVRELDVGECLRRNALTHKRPGMKIKQGAVVTVVETLEAGNAFLVEFGDKMPEKCDWLGVLYPAELEFVKAAAR